ARRSDFGRLRHAQGGDRTRCGRSRAAAGPAGESHRAHRPAMSDLLSLPAEAMLPTLHVVAGQVHCTAEPLLLMTVLGSCVSVCLWDAVLRRGGMNHFM